MSMRRFWKWCAAAAVVRKVFYQNFLVIFSFTIHFNLLAPKVSVFRSLCVRQFITKVKPPCSFVPSRCQLNEKWATTKRRHATGLFTVMGVGRRGQREAKTPLDFEMISKKLLFLQFRGEKVNFTTFGPRWKTFWENPLLPPPGKNPFYAHVYSISECLSELVRSRLQVLPTLVHRLYQVNSWFLPVTWLLFSIYIAYYFLFIFLLFSATCLKRFAVTQQAKVGAIVGGVIGGLSTLIVSVALVRNFIIKPSQEKDAGPYHYQDAAPYKDGRCVFCCSCWVFVTSYFFFTSVAICLSVYFNVCCCR